MERRDFVKTSAAAGAAAALSPMALGVNIAGRDTIRVGLIGCGGRGTGAAYNALEADPSVRIVGMADLFADRLDGARNRLMSDHPDRASITDETTFVGFDAYQQLLDNVECDSVILATPPHFRPAHFEAAINAGKHVFMEKPVAVDPAGIRRVIASAKKASDQKLSVVTGTQRRHQLKYLDLIERIHDGAIGEPVAAYSYWNQGALWHKEQQPDWSDMEWQCRNWLYFAWLSGDHIVEQHIHNLDVVNWVAGGPPKRAMGMGGRQVRTGKEFGHIFDHFAIEYEYDSGMMMTSMCRQIQGCDGRVDEWILGSEGKAFMGRGVLKGRTEYKHGGGGINPYVQEHKDLYASVRGDGSYLNEAKRTAESTLTAIMGRLTAYTGKSVTFEQALNLDLDLSPPKYAFGPLPMPSVAVPGQTPLG